jgi:hypothetical protein
LGVEWKWLRRLFVGSEGEDGLFLGWVVVMDGAGLVRCSVPVSGFEVDEEEGAEDEDHSCDCTCMVSPSVRVPM